jgi:hypothetical protein
MASQTRSVSVTTGYVSLPSLTAKRVSILNSTGAALLIRMASDDGANEEISIPDATSCVLETVANAAEIQIKAAGAASGVNLIIDN